MFRRIAQKFKRRSHQGPEEIEMQILRPRVGPDEVQDSEPSRPYRDWVENEARQYWLEISGIGSLTKPSRRDLIMGINCLAFWNRSGYRLADKMLRPVNVQPGLKTGMAQAVVPGRPYRDFVEGEARKYWSEIGSDHNLAKPAQEEIRTAALPILCLALRNRFGHKRHRAVAAVVQYAYENGLIRRPFSDAHESPSPTDALIQLADDANTLAREIHLPDHLPPHHPPVYYTIKSNPDRPVPRKDAFIRGDYLYDFKWRYFQLIDPCPVRLITQDCFHPSTQLSVRETDFDTLNRGHPYYTLEFMPVRGPISHRPVNILLHWKEDSYDPPFYCLSTIYYLYFSPCRWDPIPDPLVPWR